MIVSALIALALGSHPVDRPISQSMSSPYKSTVKRNDSSAPDFLKESKSSFDRRMNWFRDARFGMFIHWGLYSIPAGAWKGKDVGGISEWIMSNAKIQVSDYEPLKDQFNPVNFDAKKWVAIAKGAGMKYIVITSKHHDGFAMYPSKIGTWNIGHSPFKRDPLKELAVECKKAGLRLCFYHSIMDWHHPDFLPKEAHDTRITWRANHERYISVLKAQLKELLTEYGPIGILWFDGEWKGWSHERGKDMYNYVRSLQPNIIINNRVDVGRNGMEGMTKDGFVGDYGTPEQEIPSTGIASDWESCMTMNDSWGYYATNNNWKSVDTLIYNLVDCASKGGNYLLNVGPNALGEIPDPSIERLAGVGKWVEKNSEAIYGTSASPFPRALPWGKVTRKGNSLYLHVFEKSSRKLLLPGLKTAIRSVSVLGESTRLSAVKNDSGWVVDLGAVSSGAEEVKVLKVNLAGKPVVEKLTLRPDSQGNLNLNAVEAKTTGSVKFEGDGKNAIGFWSDPSSTVTWDAEFLKPGKYSVDLEHACPSADFGGSFTLSVGSQNLNGTVVPTGSWTSFKVSTLGTVTIEKAGLTTIRVKAQTIKGNGLMNLRNISFRPLP